MTKKTFLFIIVLFVVPICAYTSTNLQNLERSELVGQFIGLPVGLGGSLIYEESRGYSTAAGKNRTDMYYSRGVAQINQTCEKELADKYFPGGHSKFDVWNPAHSALVGCNYLLALYNHFGTWEMALWAYNWGPGNVSKIKYGKIVPERVKKYAHNILSRVHRSSYFTLALSYQEQYTHLTHQIIPAKTYSRTLSVLTPSAISPRPSIIPCKDPPVPASPSAISPILPVIALRRS